MLFKDYHIPLIRSGSKTVTRREWAENYGRPTVGSVQIASTEMFTSDEEADCYIRILDVYDQPLGEMTDEDARKEGDYESLEEFREGYAEVYGEDAWDPEKVVAVVEFEYVGRERPKTDAGQQQLVTDGGTEDQGTVQSVDEVPICHGCGLMSSEFVGDNAICPDCFDRRNWWQGGGMLRVVTGDIYHETPKCPGIEDGETWSYWRDESCCYADLSGDMDKCVRCASFRTFGFDHYDEEDQGVVVGHA